MIKNKTHILLKTNSLILVILTISCQISFAQFFDESQSPLSVKWRAVEHQGFKIIFPSPIENDAKKLAQTIPQIYPRIAADFGLQKSHIPIILQNQGTSANGFVQLAPKKSVFYTIYPQNFDSQNWLNNLSVHELRHLAQFDKISGSSGFPFPQYLYFAYIGLSTPIWFLEGDAVHTETRLTSVGRGRQPEWIMPFRARLLEGETPSYSEAYFGSEKNQSVGYYQLGYLFTAQLHHDLGSTISNQLLSEINQKPIRLYPFSRSLKKISGYNTSGYYQKLIRTLKSDWEEQDRQSKSVNYPSLNAKPKYATDYHFVHRLADGSLLTLKQSKQQSPALVSIDSSKNEKILCRIGTQEEPWFDAKDSLVVWDENRSDARYKQRSYNVICTYNLLTGKKKQLSRKTRLFAPRLSADGSKIIVVNIDYANRSKLLILDSKNGQKIDSISNADNDALQYPTFSPNGNEFAWISVNEAGKSLWIGNNKQRRALISHSRQQLSNPVFWENKIVFNAHFNGINNIYCIDTASLEIKALTAAKYGAFNPSIDSAGMMLFNNYTAQGYSISKIRYNPQPIGEDHFVKYTPDTKAKDDIFQNLNYVDTTFIAKPYRAFRHIFNFHSISPSSSNQFEKVGLQIQSDDLLNTTSFSAGINYVSSLKRAEYEMNFAYKALYPIIKLSYINRPRLAYYRLANTIHQAKWREDYVGLTISQPISFNLFQHQYSASAEVGSYFVQRDLDAADKVRIINRLQFPLSYRIQLAHQTQIAAHDIAPAWAQIVNLKYQHAPFEPNLRGKMFALNSYFYFPGIGRNHSLLTSFNFQNVSGSFSSSDGIETVYGYNQIKALNPLKNTLLFNYRFPILFPDLELGSLAYLRSVSAGVFCHYENLGTDSDISQPKTFGFELKSELNPLRYSPVATVGGRLIFVNKNYQQNPIFELLFNYFF
jgi:hypothetical protein